MNILSESGDMITNLNPHLKAALQQLVKSVCYGGLSLDYIRLVLSDRILAITGLNDDNKISGTSLKVS